MEPSYEEIIRKVNVLDENVVAVYLHGSFLYGTQTPESGMLGGLTCRAPFRLTSRLRLHSRAQCPRWSFGGR
jgi:hypothetical protein